MLKPAKNFWSLTRKEIGVLVAVMVLLISVGGVLQLLTYNTTGASFLSALTGASTVEAAPTDCLLPNADGSAIDFFSGSNATTAASPADCHSKGGSTVCLPPPNDPTTEPTTLPSPTATTTPKTTTEPAITPLGLNTSGETLADVSGVGGLVGTGPINPKVPPGATINPKDPMPPWSEDWQCADFTIGTQDQLRKNGDNNSTFTSIYCYDPAGKLVFAHAVNDYHYADGSIVWWDPQIQPPVPLKLFPGNKYTLPAKGIVPDPVVGKKWGLPPGSTCNINSYWNPKDGINMRDDLQNFIDCLAKGGTVVDCRKKLIAPASSTYHSCIAMGYPISVCETAFPEGSPKWPKIQ